MMSKALEILQEIKEVKRFSFLHKRIDEAIEELLAQPEQEPVAWMYDWEDFDGDETFIKYGLITTDKKIFDSPCAMNITPLIKGIDDE